MSALVCALSGEVPTEPVVSKKSGHLFEKKLVTKYIEVSRPVLATACIRRAVPRSRPALAVAVTQLRLECVCRHPALFQKRAPCCSVNTVSAELCLVDANQMCRQAAPDVLLGNMQAPVARASSVVRDSVAE